MVIGLSGVAGAGKDLFFTLLSQRLDCLKASLADALKSEVSEFTKKEYGIDPISCSRLEKEAIRPLLVVHGTIKRDKSNGRHWIEKLNKKINKNNLTNSIVIVTDIRYDEYPEDEVYWLKKELGGYLIHISLYDEIPRLNSHYRQYIHPANTEEARNDPRLKGQADYIVDWKKEKNISDLTPHVEGFIDWLIKKENRLSAYKKAEEKRLQ
jgi:hypothetical protein